MGTEVYGHLSGQLPTSAFLTLKLVGQTTAPSTHLAYSLNKQSTPAVKEIRPTTLLSDFLLRTINNLKNPFPFLYTMHPCH